MNVNRRPAENGTTTTTQTVLQTNTKYNTTPPPSANVSVPDIAADDDTLSSALAYAKSGLYVGPVKHRTKDPAMSLGKGWPQRTSLDPEMIASWFAGSDYGVFLHAGRSGVVIFDVDAPEKLHPLIQRAFDELKPPYQTTRRGETERGHYLFQVPPGRTLGNSLGGLASGWGEIRGRNGLVVAAPSVHASDDGEYLWRRTGPVPVLPSYLADELPDALDAAEVATGTEVSAFLNAHTDQARPDLLTIHAAGFNKTVTAGESRHHSMTGHLAGAMREAAAGLVDAQTAADTLESIFLTAVAQQPNGKQGSARTGASARNEWAGLLAWSVAQARAADPAATLARVAEKFPPSVTIDEMAGGSGDRGVVPSGSESDDPQRQATDGSKKPNAATKLVHIAQHRYTFGRSVEGEPFALPTQGPRIVTMLRGGTGSLRSELAAAFLTENGSPPPQQALQDALLALEGLCGEQPEQRLWLRTAQHGDALWLDVGDATGDVIKLDATGWSIETAAPVLHRRTALTAPLTRPARGGDLTKLWSLVNVAERDRALLLGFMVAALLPDIPHPILSLAGEQGAGKSTAAKIIGSTLDASTVPLRKAPKDLEAWTTAAVGSHVVAVDNLSTVPDWLSDALCRASTGDGDVRRKLYTDGDLHVVSFRRVVILNGIDLGSVRDDLADRLINVELHRIEGADRTQEQTLLSDWDQAKPSIAGGLLDLAAQVLAALPTMRLDHTPRMADFAHVLAAVDQVLGTDGLGRYRSLAGELATDAVTSDPVLAALSATVTNPWSGACADLLDTLTATLGDGRLPRDWPKTARSLGILLKRRAPSLRRVGWIIEQTEERGERGVIWHLSPRLTKPDERLTKPDETADEPISSGSRQVLRQDGTPVLTCNNAESAQNPDELTRNPPSLCHNKTEKEEYSSADLSTRDCPESSSVRQFVRNTSTKAQLYDCGHPALMPEPGRVICRWCEDNEDNS